MPTSTIRDRRAQHFDKNLELRSYQSAAISADATETGVALTASAHECFKLVVHSDVYSGFSAGTVQWTIAIEAATTIGGTYRTIESVVLDGTKAGTYELAVSGLEVEQIVSGAKFVRVRATRLGAAGALTYGAFISPGC